MDESKRNEWYFLVAIDDKRRDYKHEVYTARNDYERESGFDRVEEVWEFINCWESALQDQAFYERRAARDKELKELAEEIVGVLEWGQKIPEEKDIERMDELVREGGELSGESGDGKVG